jgi:hypothetical protein
MCRPAYRRTKGAVLIDPQLYINSTVLELQIIILIILIIIIIIIIIIKVKSLYLFSKASRHEDVCGSGGIVPPFLTSAIDVGEWSASRSGRFTPWKRTPIPIG